MPIYVPDAELPPVMSEGPSLRSELVAEPRGLAVNATDEAKVALPVMLRVADSRLPVPVALVKVNPCRDETPVAVKVLI